MEAKRLERYRRLLYSNAPLIGGWLRRKTVEWLMNDGAPEAVRVLEEAAAHNGDEQIQSESMTALRRLAEQGNAEAQEALCRLTIFHDLPLARETALALSCAPRDASQRALFYFLTGQWDEYERLDFDHSLLREVYKAGDERLRQRIGERARGAGRVEWVEVVVGRRQGRQLGEVTDSEWEVTLEVLSGSGRWSEMWRLAQEAPARWGARLLQRLSGTGWVPDGDANRAEYEELARLAGRWTETGLDSLAWCRLWNLADGATLKTMEGYGYGPINCLAISPDGQALAVGVNGVRLWSLPDGAPLKAPEGRESDTYDRGAVSAIAFSPDGRILACGYNTGGGLPLGFWSMPDGARLFSMEKRFARTWGAHSLAFGQDWIALVQMNGVCILQLWRNSEYLSRANPYLLHVKILALSPDGRTLVGGRGETVCLWSLPEGTLRWRQVDGSLGIRVVNGPILCSKLISTTSSGTCLCEFDGTRHRPVYLPLKTKMLAGHKLGITSLAISPDGRILASGSWDGTVRLWSLPDGAPLNILTVGSDVYSLAFSPDGWTLAIGCAGNVVRLWSFNPFYRRPISQAGIADMVWVQETLRNGDLNAEQRNCLEFIAALIRLRRRFDIQLGEPTRRIEAGEFDIEIEG